MRPLSLRYGPGYAARRGGARRTGSRLLDGEEPQILRQRDGF